MAYLDVDYCVRDNHAQVLSKNYDVIDVYFVRKPHYCKDTKEYWDAKQDESIYLKVKEEISDIERTVLLAKNEVNEFDMYFDDDFQKKAFYEDFRDNKFYNNLTLHTLLSDKQAVQFLGIMASNSDDYDYNFQYCDQERVIKNIVSSNLEKGGLVDRAYKLYLDSVSSLKQKNEIDNMLSESTRDNVVAFRAKANK